MSCTDGIYNSTNLRCQEAWHAAKRDRGSAGASLLALPCLADTSIVQDVKMIHFQSNHRQHTIRCPQKVYIVS